MLIKTLIVIIVLVAVLIVIIALRPADFRITRSTSITAPPEVVFDQVNDLHKWAAWSPWEKLDPAMKRVFEGPQASTGASYRWAGNNKVGEGAMTITESRPYNLISIKLDFIKPFESTNLAEFTFKPEGNLTVVTWSMSGKNNFMAKAFCLVMNMDKMVGGDFEKGLLALKAVSEAANKNDHVQPSHLEM
jgi:uncharacterized protein YndB with AHSA1/START domain